MKTILFKLLFRLGIIPQRLYSAEQFCASISLLPIEVQEHELKKRAALIVRANDHRYYQSLLASLVGGGDIEIDNASFINKGIGESGLNTCRKVIICGKPYFEKVFFNSRPEVETADWFQQHIYDRLKHRITTAALKKTIKGKIITVAYYEFLELLPFEEVANEQVYINLTNALYAISGDYALALENIAIPLHIRDFRHHFQYQRFAHAAEARLKEVGVDFSKFVDMAMTSKKILTHGDIHLENGFKGPTLVDWDSFGIYPLGLDVAYLCYSIPLKKRQERIDFERWLDHHYRTVISASDWEPFERNFFFFLYIFAFPLFHDGDRSDIESQIIKKFNCFNAVEDIRKEKSHV